MLSNQCLNEIKKKNDELLQSSPKADREREESEFGSCEDVSVLLFLGNFG